MEREYHDKETTNTDNNNRNKEKDNQSTCCICLSELDEISQTQMDSCRHTFHIDCITTWGKHSRACPLCKAPFSYFLFQGKKIELQEDEVLTEDSSVHDDFEFGDDGSDYEEDDFTPCEVCQERCEDGDLEYVYCRGNCGNCVHLNCLGLRSTRSTWYCVDCLPQRVTVNRPRSTSTQNERREYNPMILRSLTLAEESIARQLREMRQIQRSILPRETLPSRSETAIRLRSKSKLANEIERDIVAEISSSSSQPPFEKRFRRDNIPPTSGHLSRNNQSTSSLSAHSVEKLSEKASSSRQLSQNSSVSNLLTQLMTPSTSRSGTSSSVASLPSSSYYTTTSSSSKPFSSTPMMYSISHPVESSTPLIAPSTNSSSPISNDELIHQYLSRITRPLHFSASKHSNSTLIQQKREQMIEMIPKIFSLCLMRDRSFLLGLLDQGLLQILTVYLRSKDPLDQSPLLPSHLQEMILRTISCLPIQSKHLFSTKLKLLEEVEQNEPPQVLVGKFISLIHVLESYLPNTVLTQQREEDEKKRSNEENKSLSIISQRILRQWVEVLKRYPHAVEKIQAMIKPFFSSFE